MGNLVERKCNAEAKTGFWEESAAYQIESQPERLEIGVSRRGRYDIR